MNIPSSEEFAERIAPYGDTSKGIRKSKPDDNGLVQYVWRMSRFFSGDDMHMPVTAYWWLQDWIDEQGIDASVSGIHDEKGKEIMNELNDVIGRVLREEFGMDDTRAARRWSKAGLF